MKHPTQQEFNQQCLDKENDDDDDWPVLQILISAIFGFAIGLVIGYFL